MNEIKISGDAVFAAARELCECARDTPPESWSCSDCEREAHRALEAAYPLLRQQWEAEFLESLKKHGGDQWQEGYEAGCSMSHSLGCDAVEAQRDHLASENARLSAVVAEAIARDIEAAGRDPLRNLAWMYADEAARIARAAGERLSRPNGTEDLDA